MKNKNHIGTPPWCPFCGQTVGRPRPPKERKLGEFDCGTCQCGAVYTCDPTGHNVGAAMVEALVFAAGDDWDLAWELVPEDDYLTGRIENYDEVSHQVLDQKHLDGRHVRGVLYFVRIHSDIKEVAERRRAKTPVPSGALPQGKADLQQEELPLPRAGEKRTRRKATKNQVKELAKENQAEELALLAFDDVKTLWYLQRLLYSPVEEERWRTAHLIGRITSLLATRKPGAVSDLLHRLFEACSDSAATHWGLIETIGEVVAGRPDIFGAFTRHLLRFVGHPTTRRQAVWALGTIAAKRPDLIRNTPFYQLFPLLDSPDPATQALALRLMGRIRATEVAGKIEELTESNVQVTYFENGCPVATTIGALAREAQHLLTQTEAVER